MRWKKIGRSRWKRENDTGERKRRRKEEEEEEKTGREKRMMIKERGRREGRENR